MTTSKSQRAHVYGNNVDTDVIIPARYLNQATPEHLAKYCMIDIDAEFAGRVATGDIMIAGNNFGCGSSREHAPLAIKSSGVNCVIAKSFARIFQRNAINIGLQVIEADTEKLGAMNGDTFDICFESGTITNTRSGATASFQPPAHFVGQIIDAGGLIPYVTGRMNEGSTADSSTADKPTQGSSEVKA